MSGSYGASRQARVQSDSLREAHSHGNPFSKGEAAGASRSPSFRDIRAKQFINISLPSFLSPLGVREKRGLISNFAAPLHKDTSADINSYARS